MPATPSSNIRAYVRWRESSVYAGEEIECIITFKNVAEPAGRDAGSRDVSNGYPRGGRPVQPPSASQSRRSSIAQGKPPLQRTSSMASTSRGGQPARGHRPALSLNMVTAPSRGGLHSAPIAVQAPNGTFRPATGHGRSLSIMSLGSDVPSDGRGSATAPIPQRPFRGHGRSTSLQAVSRPPLQNSQGTGSISPRQPSPLYESTTPPALAEDGNEPPPIRPARRRPGTVSAGDTPQIGRQNSLHKSSASGTLNAGFQFPAVPSQPAKSPSPQPERRRRSPSNMHSGQHRALSPRPLDGWTGPLSNLNPISRVMSETSAAGTPRSSSEFYSMSNHSDETLTSEVQYQNPEHGRVLPRPSYTRNTSTTSSRIPRRAAEPETLIMGYAQTIGHFVLDGSLVNAAPFEAVKRRGVQGGGGVVGIDKAKRSSVMFGAFSWGNIGESLSGLLGGDEMSSLAQMKASAGSKNIPLLSTPQHLLFVDLRLEPGESRSYNYKFSLPRGLPPSHRGRAIRVSYNLTLGIQRPGGQAVKHIEIPFRLLGSYNARGETLGHDLMSPYVLLQDTALSTNALKDPSTPSEVPRFKPKMPERQAKPPKHGLEDFLRYTERLLESPANAYGALASPTLPTSPTSPRKESTADQPPSTIKDVVDFAILRSNLATNANKKANLSGASANRFNIAKSGNPVAVLSLLRPAYRLGESVIGTIDFTAPPPEAGLPSPSPTYSILAELESAETVDASLAIRSSNSINRVTRKIHASMRDNSLYARRLSFSLPIPTTATPTFETTGVSLVWRLRVEFTTERQAQGLGAEGMAGEGGVLLEEISEDERGTTFLAKEKLVAETFEIEVPLRVLGVADVASLSGGVEVVEV